MKTILPLLFFGVVAGSCLVGAAGMLPAFRVERWVNSMPLTVEGSRQGYNLGHNFDQPASRISLRRAITASN
jgi:hypothetical protein